MPDKEPSDALKEFAKQTGATIREVTPPPAPKPTTTKTEKGKVQ